ncbi:MAG: amidohydrolase family protein [Acetobacteraceae bacterium]
MTQNLIDAHFHIWRQRDLPWLNGPMVPRIFGPYEPLRRDYPIEEFLADQAGSGVEAAIYVQTNWASERALDEVAWVASVAHTTGWPQAITAFVDLTADDIRPALDQLAAHPLVRGVRMQLHWHENPRYRFAPSPTQLIDAQVSANIGRLAEYDLAFELQLFPAQMQDGARLAETHPDVRFVLVHAGMLTDIAPATVAAWRSGLRALAACPNVYVKLSGLGTFVHRNDPALIARIIDDTIAIFGANRLMFGSNFPIEKLWTSHADLVAAYRAALAHYSEREQRDVFCNVARKVYRLR